MVLAKVWRGRVRIWQSIDIIVTLRATTPTTTMGLFSFGSSVFQDGQIKPGIYKIRNVESKTYVDIKDHVRELCGRPSTALEDERGLVRPQYDRSPA